MSLHIAWIGKKSPFCGNVTYSREITNGLLDREHKVSFLHFAQEESAEENWPNRSEVPLPFIYKSQVYTIPSLNATKVLTKSLKSLKPDIVHASLTLSPIDFILPEICEELDIPLVATFHPPFSGKGVIQLVSGTQFLAYQLYAPFLVNYDRVIVFSQVQSNLLASMGVRRENIAIIPNGVDTEKYSPGSSRVKTEFDAERLFVYQGRVASEKNVESLLRGWKQAGMQPSSKLLVVGDGLLKSSLENFYGPEIGVIWLGFVADENRRIDILRGADAFILPSLVEGLSLSLLEAMACGVACIATDVGADGEVLEKGAGVILSPKSTRSQLKTLLPLFQDHQEITTLLGQKARQRVLERYTLSENIDRVVQLYKEVLQQSRLQLSRRRL